MQRTIKNNQNIYLIIDHHGGIKIHCNDTTTQFIVYSVSEFIENHLSMANLFDWK